MNCDNRLLTAKDVSTIQDKTLVKLSSIMSESDKIQAGKR